MEGLRAGRSVVQKEARWVAPMEVRTVVQKEVPRVDWKVDRTEVPRVDRMEAHSVVPMEGPMGVLKADRSEVSRVDWKVDRTEVPREDRKVVPRVDRTGECLEGSGRMAEPVEVLLRLQVGVVEVRWRFPLRVQVGPRAVLPEPRARALPKSQARGLPAWKEAVRAGGQRQGLPRVQEEWPRLAPVLGKEEDRSRR